MSDSHAQLMVPCDDLKATLDFFTGHIGFQVNSIFPADNPRIAVLDGHGMSLRLSTRCVDPIPSLRIAVKDPSDYYATELVAPNGTQIRLVSLDEPLVVPEGTVETVVSRFGGDDDFGVGRAGMNYRDLIPGRHGGRFIASHIRVDSPGPVPDYVHYHKIRFQFLYCRRGWAKLAYQDQGKPFFFSAGDCVLQPPEIRHRVIESAGPLEVIEIGCPAEHMTMGDRDMDLPNGPAIPGLRYGGQAFVHHRKEGAVTGPWWQAGFESRDTGIAEATDGLISVCVVTPLGEPGDDSQAAGEFQFFFVLDGECSIETDHESVELGSGDSLSVAAGARFRISQASANLELLSASVPT